MSARWPVNTSPFLSQRGISDRLMRDPIPEHIKVPSEATAWAAKVINGVDGVLKLVSAIASTHPILNVSNSHHLEPCTSLTDIDLHYPWTDGGQGCRGEHPRTCSFEQAPSHARPLFRKSLNWKNNGMRTTHTLSRFIVKWYGPSESDLFVGCY